MTLHRLALATAATLAIAAPAHAWSIGGALSSIGSAFSSWSQSTFGPTTSVSEMGDGPYGNTVTERHYSPKLGRYVTRVAHPGPGGTVWYTTNGQSGFTDYSHHGVSRGPMDSLGD